MILLSILICFVFFYLSLQHIFITRRYHQMIKKDVPADDDYLLPYGFPHLFATFIGLGFSLGVSLAVLFLFYTQVSLCLSVCLYVCWGVCLSVCMSFCILCNIHTCRLRLLIRSLFGSSLFYFIHR